MPQWCHPAHLLAGVLQHELRAGAAHLAVTQVVGDLTSVYPVGAAGDDQQRLAVGLEYQRVRDLGNCATKAFGGSGGRDRKSTRLNSSHVGMLFAMFCLRKKKKITERI